MLAADGARSVVAGGEETGGDSFEELVRASFDGKYTLVGTCVYPYPRFTFLEPSCINLLFAGNCYFGHCLFVFNNHCLLAIVMLDIAHLIWTIIVFWQLSFCCCFMALSCLPTVSIATGLGVAYGRPGEVVLRRER